MKRKYLSLLLAATLLLSGIPAEGVYASDLAGNTSVIQETVQEEAEGNETVEQPSIEDTNEESVSLESETETKDETEAENVTSIEKGESKETSAAVSVKEKSAEELAAYDALEDLAKEILAKLQDKYADVTWVEGSIYSYTNEFGDNCTVDLYDPDLYKLIMEDIPTETAQDELDVVTEDTYVTTSPFIGGNYYQDNNHGSRQITHGIDVSHHQSSVNWTQAKNAGVSFAFIRLGFRGYGSTGTLNTDTKGVEYVNGAYNAGIQVGVYFFSQAISEEEARAEANYLNNIINQNGLAGKITLPVVIDYEFPAGGRLSNANLSGAKHQSICNAFCNQIQELGEANGRNYKPMIYADYTTLTQRMNVAGNSMSYVQYWIARYNNATGYNGDYSYWQYTSKGTVPGISGGVDCDFRYGNVSRKKITDSSIVVSPPSTSDYIGDLKNRLSLYDTEYKKYLVKGTDYKATGKEISNGYQYEIEGIGNYIGKFTHTVTVSKSIELTKSMVANIPEQVYTGKAIDDTNTVRIVVANEGNALIKGQDYTVSFSNNIGIGQNTAKVTIKGCGNYFGTVEKTFSIAKRTILSSWITPLEDQIYRGRGQDGKEIPITTQNGLTVEIKDANGTVLKEGTDYKITYRNNIRVGKASVIIEGLGIYKGKITKYFTIGKDTLGDDSFTIAQDMTVQLNGMDDFVGGYTGKQVKPVVTVVKKGITLKLNKDYSVLYKDNINIGDQAYVVIKGKGGYIGSCRVHFAISKYGKKTKLNANMINFMDGMYVYQGQGMKPDAVVICNGRRLVRDTDYTVTYQDIRKNPLTEIKEVGSYNLIVTGIGAYEGTVTKRITIKKPVDNKILFSSSTMDITYAKTEGDQIIYTGSQLKPVITVVSKTENNQVLVEKKDYTVRYVNNTNAGTAKYIVTGKGNYKGSVTGTFTIEKRDIGSLTGQEMTPINQDGLKISLRKYAVVFNGKRQAPVITAKYGKSVLKLNQDYLVSYSDAGLRNAGKYTMKMMFHGNLTGEVTIPYEIQKANLSKVSIQIPKQYYQGKPIMLSPSDVVFKLGAVKLSESDLKGISFTGWENNTDLSSGKMKATATCVASADSNFDETTAKNISFKIYRKQMKNADLEYTIGGLPVNGTEGTYQTIYDGTAKTPENGATLQIKDKAYGQILVENVDYKVKYTANTNAGKAKITVTGYGKYEGKNTVTFVIKGKEFEQGGTLLSDYSIRCLWEQKEITDKTFNYTGGEIRPNIEFKYKGKKLAVNKDYKLQFDNNVNAGTASVTVVGKGNYVGTIKKTYVINPKKGGTVVIGKIENQQYTGKTIVPSFSVTVDARELKRGVDYTVYVSNSTKIGKNGKGIATVTVTGIGNYSGTLGRKNFIVYK